MGDISGSFSAPKSRNIAVLLQREKRQGNRVLMALDQTEKTSDRRNIALLILKGKRQRNKSFDGGGLHWESKGKLLTSGSVPEPTTPGYILHQDISQERIGRSSTLGPKRIKIWAEKGVSLLWIKTALVCIDHTSDTISKTRVSAFAQCSQAQCHSIIISMQLSR